MPVSCSFDDLDFTDFQQLAEAFHEVQPWSSSASLALNFPSDYDVLKSMLSHDMSQEIHLPRSDSVHQFPLCSSLLNTTSFVTWSFQDMCSILL